LYWLLLLLQSFFQLLVALLLCARLWELLCQLLADPLEGVGLVQDVSCQFPPPEYFCHWSSLFL